MEINKLKENLKLSRKEREINYWSLNYDNAFQNLDGLSIINEQVILDNEISTNQFKEEYPFYKDLLLLVNKESDLAILKTKIVELIISYLEIINEDGNVLIERSGLKSISKKVYSKEKARIFKNLERMLFEAMRRNKIEKKITSSQEGVKQDSSYKKPGRKKVSELAVFALKYHIRGMFNKAENPYSDVSRFANVGSFYEYVASVENLKKGSFSNKYKEINREKSLEKYCKSNPNVVQALIDSNCFTKEKECSDFLSQFGVDVK